MTGRIKFRYYNYSNRIPLTVMGKFTSWNSAQSDPVYSQRILQVSSVQYWIRIIRKRTYDIKLCE